MPLVFNFKVNDSGVTEVTLDSPQQNVKDLPAEVKYCEGDSVAVEELPLSERRPQTPVPPFPSDGTILAGTLTIPANSIGEKPTIVVMVTGSGPQICIVTKKRNKVNYHNQYPKYYAYKSS